ncbi:hypothetical protein ABPG74_015990 [Tetrahymena malaccensis]
MDQAYKQFLVTDDLKFTIEWSSNQLILINNLDPKQKVCLHINEQIGKQVQVCISENYVAQTIYLSEGSYQFILRDYSKFTQAISTDPKKVNIPSPIVAIYEQNKHTILLFTKDYEIYSLKWKLITEDSEINPYTCKQAVSIHLQLELNNSKQSKENQIQMEGKLIKMKYEKTLDYSFFYLQSSNCKRIYKVQHKEGQTLVQSCIQCDKESSIQDFDVYNGKVYATLIKQKQKTFTLATAEELSDKFSQEKEIDCIENAYQINTHLFKIIDTFNNNIYNYILISYLLKKQDNQNQLKVILIDLNLQQALNSNQILEKRIAIGTISCTNNRAEDIQALHFKKIVNLKRNNKVFIPLYEKTLLGNENAIIVNTIQLQKAEIGCQESNQEQCDNLFQQLVLKKNSIYDKSYVLIRPNPIIDEYIEIQQNKIPNYIQNYDADFDQNMDVQSLKFLYLLIVNKQHTLLTDIINTRTIVRKNQEVCEYLILNLEQLEKELSFLMFQNDVLRSIRETNFLNFNKQDYKQFYELVQIISEIFNSILVRKQKEAFEDLRERNLSCISPEHQISINNANSLIEQIASQICIIKISGWLLDQNFQNQNLSQLLFSSDYYVKIIQQQIANRQYDQTGIIKERNHLLDINIPFNVLFCDKIFQEMSSELFDPIKIIKTFESNKSVGINLHSFALYRYIYELAKLNKEFELTLQNYEKHLSYLSNNGYVNSIVNVSNGQLFRCLCLIDDLNQQNKFQVFNLIIENKKIIQSLSPDFILFIICTFAAHSFKEEAFLLIRQFNKEIDWIQASYPSILVNIYLKFNSVSQAMQFSFAIKNCTVQIEKKEIILQELIPKIIEKGQEEMLFREELMLYQDEQLVESFYNLINSGRNQLILIFIKYLIYRNQYLTAMEVFENYQKTIVDYFEKEQIEFVLALFSSILKQYSSIQCQELVQSYQFLTQYNVLRQYDQNQMNVENQNKNFANNVLSSSIKSYNLLQQNLSTKKPIQSFEENNFLGLINQDLSKFQNFDQNQMIVDNDINMTPQQSYDRLDMSQSKKSKRKWTTSKKKLSPN